MSAPKEKPKLVPVDVEKRHRPPREPALARTVRLHRLALKTALVALEEATPAVGADGKILETPRGAKQRVLRDLAGTFHMNARELAYVLVELAPVAQRAKLSGELL